MITADINMSVSAQILILNVINKYANIEYADFTCERVFRGQMHSFSKKTELYQYLEMLYEGKIMKNEGAITVLLLQDYVQDDHMQNT